MSYYNCCDIRPKHSNISKRVGEGVITICVVLHQSTVIFQKGRGRGSYYNLCGIRSRSCQDFETISHFCRGEFFLLIINKQEYNKLNLIISYFALLVSNGDWKATIDDRDLIFGHKHHIGTSYRGKHFWTHQIPTSCLPTWFLYTLNIHFVYARKTVYPPPPSGSGGIKNTE
jgi:hypothetical protein